MLENMIKNIKLTTLKITTANDTNNIKSPKTTINTELRQQGHRTLSPSNQSKGKFSIRGNLSSKNSANTRNLSNKHKITTESEVSLNKRSFSKKNSSIKNYVQASCKYSFIISSYAPKV